MHALEVLLEQVVVLDHVEKAVVDLDDLLVGAIALLAEFGVAKSPQKFSDLDVPALQVFVLGEHLMFFFASLGEDDVLFGPDVLAVFVEVVDESGLGLFGTVVVNDELLAVSLLGEF